MALADLFEGEGRLFGFLGANLTLGGARVVFEKVNLGLQRLMPCLTNMLLLIQIAVALTTLVYTVMKIKRIWNKKADEVFGEDERCA